MKTPGCPDFPPYFTVGVVRGGRVGTTQPAGGFGIGTNTYTWGTNTSATYIVVVAARSTNSHHHWGRRGGTPRNETVRNNLLHDREISILGI